MNTNGLTILSFVMFFVNGKFREKFHSSITLQLTMNDQADISIIHEYFGVDAENIWDSVVNKLPELKSYAMGLTERIIET